MFRKFALRDWRQFSDVELEFHERLTILTGANATGKTTILHILSRHFGWNIPFIRTPRRWKKKYVDGFLSEHWDDEEPESPEPPAGRRQVGEIEYSPDGAAQLFDPGKNQPTFQVEIHQQKSIKGLHIPSHRPVPSHAPVNSIPTAPPTKEQAFNNYLNEVRSRYVGGRSNRSPTHHIKETLTSLAALGSGSDRIRANPELMETLEGIEEILRVTLPPSLGFQRFAFDPPEVFLETATGGIALDAISGGMASIVDMAWQVFMYSPKGERYVVLIDEPENHLHPAMQRTVLADFLRAFPLVQFIVASHSPFIVSSVPDSNVYVLDYDDGEVYSKHLESINKAGTSNEILRDVLGLPTTMPVWVERGIEDVVQKFAERELSSAVLEEFSMELRERGLQNIVAEAIEAAIKERRADDRN